MVSRFKPQHPSMLEIRGLSRGSLSDNNRLDNLHSSLQFDLHISSREHGIKAPHLTSDSVSDDDSTITNGSESGLARHKGMHSEDSMTVSESSHYWSGANSFTTGNTTERSSVYSWGDDEFDYQASRMVQQMFHAIEKMLFESVLSGSSLLQHECREWMESFPHLRILGKQTCGTREEGFQSVPSISDEVSTPTSALFASDSDFASLDISSLEVSGAGLTPSPVPMHLLIHTETSGVTSGHSSEFSHLTEEIFEEDGNVEEYLAYDIREIDEEETAKRYHVPRRRRLGYPPITPNACVRDAVLNHLFDITWAKLVGYLDNHKSLGGSASKRNLKSLWKVLFDSYMMVKNQQNKQGGSTNDSYLYQNRQSDENYYDDKRRGFEDTSFPMVRQPPEIFIERNSSYVNGLSLPHSNYNFTHPAHSRLLTHDALPPSRGSYMDQGLSGGRQFFSPVRLSTAPYTSDFNSLNDVMKISQKKLQVRAVPQGLQNEESIGSFPGPLVTGPSSPQGLGGRSYLPYSATNRQPSARHRGKTGRPARLLPLALDRAKTPTMEFDGMVKATKLRISSSGPSNFDGPPEIVGSRLSSSPLQKPPTAPAFTSGNLWLNSRLPPISLEALNENSSVEFKKPRGRTAHSRISSAVAEDSLNKQSSRVWEGLLRPNTTQAFRTDIPFMKRATSVTPSSLSIGNFGGSVLLPKSSSPSGIPVTIGSLAESNYYSPNFSHSPDNQVSGLVGITGIGMLGTTTSNLSHSPNDHDEDSRPVHSSWGNPMRRKKPIIGT